MAYVFLNGKVLPKEEASIPIDDRGFLFGDGVYTTLCVRDGAVLFYKEHLKRFQAQCAELRIDVPPLQEEWLFELIERNQASEGIFRLKWIQTAGPHEEQALPRRPRGQFLMMLDPFHPPPYAPLACVVYPMATATSHSHYKSLSPLNRFYVMEYAKQRSRDDAVTMTEGGLLLEAAFGNLCWFKEEHLYFPDPALPLYQGVTLSMLLQGALEEGYKIHPVKARLSDIPEEAQLFRTNTLRGIRPLVQLNERIFQRDLELEKRLQSLYQKLCKREALEVVLQS
jgi:4-amino-4-deoxychorismate lyase